MRVKVLKGLKVGSGYYVRYNRANNGTALGYTALGYPETEYHPNLQSARNRLRHLVTIGDAISGAILKPIEYYRLAPGEGGEIGKR